MNKNNIAVIGMGGAGNKMLDALLDINRIYTPVYMNTSTLEMDKLKHITSRNMLYVTNGEGTGKNKQYAKEVLKDNYPKILSYFAEKFSPVSGIDTFFLICGASGGSGGTMLTMLPKLLKKINENISINAVVAMPDLDEKEDSLRNAIQVWKELNELQSKGFINSVQFIDNNKMGNDQEEFNKATMESLDESLSINYDEIDLNDSKKVNCENGYKVVLNLSKHRATVKDAVDEAIKESNFLLPNNLECNILMATFDEDYYNKNELKGVFKVYGDEKYDYNMDERNVVVLGGVEQPVDYMELLQGALETIQTKQSARNERMRHMNEQINFADSGNVTVETKEVPKPKKAKRLTKKDLAKIMGDEDLW